MQPRFSIFGDQTIILVDSNVVLNQDDSYYSDHSQNTRNQESFNIENTAISRQMIPLGQLISSSWLTSVVHNKL